MLANTIGLSIEAAVNSAGPKAYEALPLKVCAALK